MINPTKYCYGIDRQRVLQTETAGDDTTRMKRYFTPLFEEVVENGMKKDMLYLTAPTGVYRIYEQYIPMEMGQMVPTPNSYSTLLDHQGSLVFTTNSSGISVIDSSKLTMSLPPDIYPNEFSEAINDTFEPYGRKYKIHDNDSYELVFEGYW